MRRCTPQTALFGAVCSVGVFSVFEVEADLVEALFGDKVFALRTEITAVDDGINKLVRVGSEVAAAFHAANAFKAEGVPDAAGGEVGFIDEVEDRIGVALCSVKKEILAKTD